MPPLVSFLVTVYNRECYLGETLDSILKSSEKDFEVIIVDDQSSDASLEIAQKYARQDKRITVYVNQHNLGDYGNRMKAASLARGKYIKYVDSDDLIYKYSLAIMVEAMEQDNSIALALSHSMPEDERPYPWKLQPKETYKKHFLERGCLASGPTGAIIRRSAFESVGGFQQEWGVLSDIDLWMRLSAKWPIALLAPGLVWWRRHDGQEFSGAGANIRYLQDGYKLNLQTLKHAFCPMNNSDCAKAIDKQKQHHARRLISLAITQHKPHLALKLLKASKLSMFELLRGFKHYQ